MKLQDAWSAPGSVALLHHEKEKSDASYKPVGI